MQTQVSAVALELLDSVLPEKTIAEYLSSRAAVAAEKAEYKIAAVPISDSPLKKKVVSASEESSIIAGLLKEGRYARVRNEERSTKFPTAKKNVLGKAPVTISEDSFENFLEKSRLKLSVSQLEKIKTLDFEGEHHAHFVQFYRTFRSDLAKAGEGEDAGSAESVTQTMKSPMDMFSKILVKPPHPDEEEADIVRVKPADSAAEDAFARPMEPPREFKELYDTHRVPDECLRFIHACDAHDSLSLASAFESLPKALIARNLGHAHLDALAAAAGDQLVTVEIQDGKDWSSGWPEIFSKLKLSKTHLKHLKLRNCSPGLSPHLESLSTVMAKDLGNLESVDLSGTKISASEMSSLVEGLSVARLKSIKLVNCDLNRAETNDEAAVAVAQLISGSVTLKNLEIGENYFRSSGLVTIAQALKSSYLESFSVSGIFCRDIRPFCEALKERAETVTSLDLSRTGIDTAALAKLEVSVLQGPALKSLKLDGNRLAHPQAEAALIRIILATKDLELSFAELKADEAPVGALPDRVAIADRKAFRRLLNRWVQAGSPPELLKGIFASYTLTDAQILSLVEYTRPESLTLFMKEVFDRPALLLLLLRRALVFKEALDMESLRLMRRFSALNPTGALVLEDAEDQRLLTWAKTQTGAEVSGKLVWFPEVPRGERRALTAGELETLRPLIKKEVMEAVLRQVGPFLQVTSDQLLTLVTELQSVTAVCKLVTSLWGSLAAEDKADLLKAVYHDKQRFSKEAAHALFETLIDVDWANWGLTEETRSFDVSLNLSRPSHRRLLASLVALDEFVVFKFLTVDGAKTATVPDAWKSGNFPQQGKVSFRVHGKPQADDAKMKETRSRVANTYRTPTQ